MSRTITFSEALQIMKRTDGRGRKVPFSITFTTRDKRRTAKGSKHITIKRAEECGAAHSLVKHDQVGVRPLIGERDHQIAVHVRLIESINGMLVL